MKNTNVEIPVVGGQDGMAILALLSKAEPSLTFTADEIRQMSLIVLTSTSLVEAASKSVNSTVYEDEGMKLGKRVVPDNFTAAGAVDFVKSSLKALDGDSEVYETAYVQSDLYEGVPFFLMRLRISKDGVAKVVSSDLEALNYFEQLFLDAIIKPRLKDDIDKTTKFVYQESQITPYRSWDMAYIRILPSISTSGTMVARLGVMGVLRTGNNKTWHMIVYSDKHGVFSGKLGFSLILYIILKETTMPLSRLYKILSKQGNTII